jgi:hypothetical protein
VAVAEQLNAFGAHFLVEVEQVQLDELYAPLVHFLESDANWVKISSGS